MTAKSKFYPPDHRRRPVLRRDQAGAALVEFALVAGLFVMVLYGLIYFGMALATKQQVTNAAAEGARAAVGKSAADAPALASSRVEALLGAPNGRYTIGPDASGPLLGNCDPDPAIPAGTGPQCITVTITYDWRNHPVVPAAPGLRLAPVNTLGARAVVQYAG